MNPYFFVHLTKLAEEKKFKERMHEYFRAHPKATQLVGGAAGGAIGTVALMPLDNISDAQKTLSMSRDSEINRVGRSLWRTAKETYNPKIRNALAAEEAMAKGKQFVPIEKGFANLYRGMSGKVIKNIPAMGLAVGLGTVIPKALKGETDA